jgi:phosphomannomutase
MVRKFKADCGIIITASHNPEKWNALKFVTRRGQFMNQDEFRRFSRLLTRGKRKVLQYPQRVSQYSKAIDDHVQFIYQTLKRPKISLKVGIDAVNGAASRALPLLCRKLGCKVVPINCRYSPRFPRGPEPISKNLKKLSALVRRRRLDLGFACDPDGDRLAFIDESGRPISEEMTIVLAADFVLGINKGPVVVNLSTTSLIEYVAALHNQSIYRTKVGEGNVVARMLKEKAIIGGEGNGGVIYPAVNYGRDALAAAGLILAVLQSSGRPLSEHLARYPSICMVKKKIKVSGLNFKNKIERITREIPGRINRQDGLRISNTDYWIHMRPSQTEPVVRIIGESSDRQKIKDAVRKVVQIIKH